MRYTQARASRYVGQLCRIETISDFLPIVGYVTAIVGLYIDYCVIPRFDNYRPLANVTSISITPAYRPLLTDYAI